MSDVPNDYAHKRGVWSMSCPSVAMIYVKGRAAYDAAMREWRAAEPYALIAEQIAATPKPAPTEPRDAAKENWIEHYIFVSGQQWGDTPPTREEAERAWADAHPVHTTEPPEWKEVKFNPPSPEILEMYRDISKGSTRITGVDFGKDGGCTVKAVVLPNGSIFIEEVTEHPAPSDPSPLDRALSDFTARRKAKREAASYALDDDLCGYESWDAFDAAHEEARRREATQDQLARALSTPLPHDPDMHTRLMPWKGKADE